MSTFRVDLGADAVAVRAMAAALDSYLYGDDLYGVLPGALPRVTVGGVLLRLHRLRALCAQLNAEQVAALEQAERDLAEARVEWALHYARKIARELSARQDSFNWFLTDCEENPPRCAESYPPEAEKRTIIHHLFEAGAEDGLQLGELEQRQRALDGRLRRHFRAGDFVWSAHAQPAYPRSVFWWLYGRPTPRTP